jgi:hypothetical protein
VEVYVLVTQTVTTFMSRCEEGGDVHASKEVHEPVTKGRNDGAIGAPFVGTGSRKLRKLIFRSRIFVLEVAS